MESWSHEQVISAISGQTKMTCSAIHSGPCPVYWLQEAVKLFLTSLKFYLPLNLVPALIRYKKLRSKPKETLLAMLKATLRSTLMLGMMSFLGKVCMCWILKYRGLDKGMIILSSPIALQATWIESTSKLSEMSLYIMPRFFSTFWNFLKRRGLTIAVPRGQELLFSLSMAFFMYFCKYEPENVKPLMRTFYDKFFSKFN